MFIVRADGNARIGAGHLMRCLTIAEEVRKLPDAPEILVLCADSDSAKMAAERGFVTGVFHTDYKQLEEELPLWQKWITEETNTILVDSYHVTDRYLESLGEFGKVCIMDDFQKHPYPVDMVINYNVSAQSTIYRMLYTGQGHTEFCLGGDYAPLREQFQNVDYRVKEKVEQVLVTTGAGDADNIAGVIVDRLYREDLTYHVLVGRFSPHLEGWIKRSKECANIKVHFDVQDMAGLMAQCDLAVTAGGSTVYELSAVGVPYIAFSYATNQELLVDYVGAQKVAKSAGAWHHDASGTLDKLEEAFEELRGSFDLRKACFEKERNLVDGLGAGRLAKRLCVKETCG